jgi:exopolyphosphatase / guanosine-5'-triphosphate,3'-diphosphate pyrophosphatase
VTPAPDEGVRRVAAVDCGTNAVRLLIADVDLRTGRLTDVDRRLEIVRLGEGVDATGTLAPRALDRAMATLARYAQRCADAGVERVRVVATSATRDASNAADFAHGVRSVLAVEPSVVPGAEEARLSFVGAVGDLPAGLAPPFLVVDIGGGSTEVVLGSRVGGGEPGGHPEPGAWSADVGGVQAVSVDVGCVRLTERHLHSDPPTAEAVAAARADVAGALDVVAGVVDLAAARTLVGLAGSVATVTAHALGLSGYDSARIHRAVLPADAVRAACRDLLGSSRAAKASLPYLHPGRVDVIGAGALIWEQVVDRVTEAAGPVPVVTSEHDILDGVALELALELGRDPGSREGGSAVGVVR